MKTTTKISHVIKPGPVMDLRTRCGLTMAQAKNGLLGFEDSLPSITCLGCLRDMIVETRLEKFGMEDNKYTRWILGGNTGMSSATIWRVMTGIPLRERDGRSFGVPHDPADFGRCYELLQLFPEWRPRLGEVAKAHPEWTGLVNAWDELEALYVEELPTGKAPKLYDRMKDLEASSGADPE